MSRKPASSSATAEASYVKLIHRGREILDLGKYVHEGKLVHLRLGSTADEDNADPSVPHPEMYVPADLWETVSARPAVAHFINSDQVRVRRGFSVEDVERAAERAA